LTRGVKIGFEILVWSESHPPWLRFHRRFDTAAMLDRADAAAVRGLLPTAPTPLSLSQPQVIADGISQYGIATLIFTPRTSGGQVLKVAKSSPFIEFYWNRTNKKLFLHIFFCE
jgi:hypothetical protein